VPELPDITVYIECLEAGDELGLAIIAAGGGEDDAVAGRLRWRDAGAKLPGRVGLAAFDFAAGALILTEAGSKRRASLHLVRGPVRGRPWSGYGTEARSSMASGMHSGGAVTLMPRAVGGGPTRQRTS
jgi:hypothetical protein